MANVKNNNGRKVGAVAAASLAVLLVAAAGAGPALALLGKCNTCYIKTKQPSQKTPGQFDFLMACAFDITGEDMVFTVTAHDEDEAIRHSQSEAPPDCW